MFNTFVKRMLSTFRRCVRHVFTAEKLLKWWQLFLQKRHSQTSMTTFCEVLEKQLLTFEQQRGAQLAQNPAKRDLQAMLDVPARISPSFVSSAVTSPPSTIQVFHHGRSYKYRGNAEFTLTRFIKCRLLLSSSKKAKNSLKVMMIALCFRVNLVIKFLSHWQSLWQGPIYFFWLR